MATPTSNSVPTTTYNTNVFGDDLDTLLYGTKWGGALGVGTTLTYSFPVGTTYWLTDYSDDREPDSYHALDTTQQAAARAALATWAAVADVHFLEAADNQFTVGEIRLAFTDNLDSDTAAHAYLPGNQALAADVWFSADDTADEATPGSFFFSTMIHELGHALGLNHSFNLDDGYDNNFYSIMSYTASPWSGHNDNYASFYPTTPMYYDIVALQAIYGTDGLVTNPGKTTYTFGDALYFETIVDTGGKDTIVYAGSDTCTIDLRIGSFSELSEAIEFSTESSRSTVAIGPGTVIENATGGHLTDRLNGNGAKNVLRGNDGRDTLVGGRGNDTLVGGNGNDKLKGEAGKDRFDFNSTAEIGGAKHDVITDFVHRQDRIDLSTIDAISLTGANDKFGFHAKADSSLNGHAGELCWYNWAGKTYVIGDTDGNAVADFTLELTGTKTLGAGDFIL